MQTYQLSQWILFFFLYSFIGWIWESCYVSVRKKHWVNRGFMHGPMLPLYGSGALAVLICTIGVRDNKVLVFLFGMAAATVLEYVTGAVMERLFHVRYWDYSNQKLNVKGYICVSSSLCWGCFSVLLVEVVHVPFEEMMLKIPLTAAEVISAVLTVAAAVDLTQSFNEAMDMKHILMQLEESREQMKKMQEKLKAVSEELAEDYRKRSGEMISEYRKLSEEFIESYKERSEEFIENYKKRSEAFIEEYRQKGREKLSRRALFLERINEKRQARREQLSLLADRAEQLLHEAFPLGNEDVSAEEIRKKWAEELSSVRQGIFREFQKMGARTDRSYLRARRQLRRNPTAVSDRFREALDELKNYMDNKR